MKLAIIQVRGGTHLSPDVKKTFDLLNFRRKNSCVVVDNTPLYLGMAVKLKDYITWGEITEETFKLLLEKRGRIAGNKILTEEYVKKNLKTTLADLTKSIFNRKLKLKDVPGLKRYFRLTPPKGGYEKQGIKKQYSIGGALGYRKNGINDLIKKML